MPPLRYAYSSVSGEVEISPNILNIKRSVRKVAVDLDRALSETWIPDSRNTVCDAGTRLKLKIVYNNNNKYKIAVSWFFDFVFVGRNLLRKSSTWPTQVACTRDQVWQTFRSELELYEVKVAHSEFLPTPNSVTS